jgi:energy-coupling factor transporter ATP-binding protein EcfA2
LKSIKSSSDSSHELGNFSILVGPNNCGKSQTLRDIREFVTSGITDRLKVLNKVEVDLPTELEGTKGLHSSPHPSPGHTLIRGVSFDLQNRHEFAPHGNWISQQYVEAKSNPNATKELLGNMGKYWVAHLDAESRFRLSSPTESYDTRMEAPSNAMQAFFAEGKEALNELRQAFREAFEVDIALDWAAMRRFSLRIGQDFGDIPDTLDGLNLLLKGTPELATQGDGYRSFAGVVLAMLTFPERLLLLDEPEAFLHPAQARTLGRWLATYAAKRSAQVILATHSADFLWGAVSANTNASVIRLNRTKDITQFHVIPPNTIADLAQSPLLSSQPVLDSLFQKGVVVCEGDPDRAVYQAVAHNRNLVTGGDEILFIHANGKDPIKSPLNLLREAGTPVCAIADIDILNSKQVFSEILEALSGKQAPEELMNLRDSIAKCVEKTTQNELLNSLIQSVAEWQKIQHTDLRSAKKSIVSLARRASKWEILKKEGTEYFKGDDLAILNQLIERCNSLGLFIVPKGELEGWMKLGMGKGRTWNRLALEKLHEGNCPADLQKFIANIVSYLRP